MKKIGLAGGLIVLLMVIIAALTAGKMGQTSHAFARGKVVLDPSLLDRAKGITTLFIIMAGSDRPMPLGALRKSVNPSEAGDLYEFVLTKDNMQLMGVTAEGQIPSEFKLKARLDLDGQAGPDQPGDIVGEVKGVQKGDSGIVITLNRLVEP